MNVILNLLELRVLIASGAGGGTAKGSLGKYFHLQEFGEELTKLGINYKLIRELDYIQGSFPSKNIKNWFSRNNDFKKLISDFQPDLVLVDRQSNFGLEVIKSGIPLFVLLRGHYWSEVEYAKETIYNNIAMKKVLDLRSSIAEQVFGKATVILPICNFLIDVVKEHHPDQPTDVFLEGVDDKKWFKTNGMVLKHPCVGLIQDANWWRKTKEMLVLEKILIAMPEVNFYWAGDGQYKDKVLSVLGKHDNFHSLGSLQYPDKIRDFLSEIDVYALITGMEGTPLSLKEAQLMEKPVIATKVGGNAEIMEDHKTGFLVEEGSYNDLKEKVSILLNDEDLRAEMGKNGRKFIQENFSLEVSAKNFLKIIESHLDKK